MWDHLGGVGVGANMLKKLYAKFKQKKLRNKSRKEEENGPIDLLRDNLTEMSSH